MTSQYSKSPDQGATTFSVEPAGAPLPVVEILYFAGVCFFVFNFSTTFGFYLGLFATVLWYFTMYKSPKARKYRQSASFVVSSEGVDAGGRKFSKAEIHRLIIRNHISGAESSSMMFVGGNAGSQFVGGMAVAGAVMKQKRLRKLAEVSYRLDLESGGQAITLAGGLTDTTAFGLMKEVCSIIGFETK